MDDGCAKGCGGLIAIFIVLGLISMTVSSCNKLLFGDPEAKLAAKRIQEANVEADRAAEIRREHETAMRAFALETVPELQSLIDEMSREVVKREGLLLDLSREFSKVGRRPDKDKDFSRWQKAVREIARARDDLVEQRTDIYLDHKKAEHAPTIQDRSASIKAVQESVRKSRAHFQEIMKSIEDMKN